MGTHIEETVNTIKKIRYNSKGDSADAILPAIGDYNIVNPLNRAKVGFATNEGCTFRGFVSVNKVPGKFLISSNEFGEILFTLNTRVNLTHTINHLSFGKKGDIDNVIKKFKGKYGEVSPLSQHKEVTTSYGKTTNYNLDVVPTTYKSRLGLSYRVNQYTFAAGSEVTGAEAIMFSYSFEGITLHFSQSEDSLLQFVISI